MASLKAAERAEASQQAARRIEERLANIEQRLSGTEEAQAGGAASNVATPRTDSRPTEAEIVQLKQVATNPQSSAEERLIALRTLRRANARTPEIVQAMVQLLSTASDPNVRADIFRQLSGVTDPALKQPLLDGLTTDHDERVREEAAETLGPYGTDPNITAALAAAAQHDPSERVRRQAMESLQKRAR